MMSKRRTIEGLATLLALATLGCDYATGPDDRIWQLDLFAASYDYPDGVPALLYCLYSNFHLQFRRCQYAPWRTQAKRAIPLAAAAFTGCSGAGGALRLCLSCLRSRWYALACPRRVGPCTHPTGRGPASETRGGPAHAPLLAGPPAWIDRRLRSGLGAHGADPPSRAA
jgi:hypothetical protein